VNLYEEEQERKRERGGEVSDADAANAADEEPKMEK
jgi:hypothetical protein